MRCSNRWFNDCANDAEFRLVPPGMTPEESGHIGAYCHYCADRIIGEYSEKLGEEWGMARVDAHGSLVGCVRCVNSHDDLVEALEDAEYHLCLIGDDRQNGVIAKIKAALAKTKE